MKRSACFALWCSMLSSQAIAQKTLPYSDMDQWIMREIKESGIIGGQTRQLWEIGKPDTIRAAEPHVPGDSPWETSSVYAKVSGISKVSSTVFPEKRGAGFCARLETRLEEVKVLGIINIKVLATGTIFTGTITEPISDAKDPMQKLLQGVPFDSKPQAIQFDYKTKTGGARIKSSGFGKTDLPGKNAAEACVILQKRWEDKNGVIYARRIGTGWVRFDQSTSDWVNAYQLPIQYGDITQNPNYEPYMGLTNGDDIVMSAKNSHGDSKPIQEVGWGDLNDKPTHIIIRFSAGFGGAYVGAIGDTFWIDNVQIIE